MGEYVQLQIITFSPLSVRQKYFEKLKKNFIDITVQRFRG